jgi:hypothetical protein
MLTRAATASVLLSLFVVLPAATSVYSVTSYTTQTLVTTITNSSVNYTQVMTTYTWPMVQAQTSNASLTNTVTMALPATQAVTYVFTITSTHYATSVIEIVNDALTPDGWSVDRTIATVGVAIAILGIAVGIALYYKGKKAKKPRYDIKSNNVISGFKAKNVPLEILYSGQKVENVTVSKVVFWNAGDDTLDQSDIASTDPVRIQVTEGCKVLDAKRIYTKNKSNKIEIERQGESGVLVKFEFIDKGEGAVIQLIHTGTSSNDVCVCGTIKGVGAPKTRQRSVPGMAATISAACAVFITMIGVAMYRPEQLGPMQPDIIFPVAFTLAFGTALLLLSRLWDKLQWERLPAGYSAFEEQEIVTQSKRAISQAEYDARLREIKRKLIELPLPPDSDDLRRDKAET